MADTKAKKESEEKRIEGIKERIKDIKEYLPWQSNGWTMPLHLATPPQLEIAIQKLYNLDLPTFQEFEEEATLVWKSKIKELESTFEVAKEREVFLK